MNATIPKMVNSVAMMRLPEEFHCEIDRVFQQNTSADQSSSATSLLKSRAKSVRPCPLRGRTRIVQN